MTANPTLPVKFGTLDDGHNTPIVGNCNSATLASLTWVTIGGDDYIRSPDAGYPTPVAGQEVSVSLTNAAPETIPASTRIALFAEEAAALVAASAASSS